ncbi:nucleolar and spindle-associated protein 1 isoform X3 [Monodelphis domestica]|uniref:nucleolar and spindle-associated protein 1 isoform X3 n=1 Tax=Monodelphis domestica TaxID=13616 RepID=UPI0024E2722C|nr:nucleolar and spindle-associated protein 1 isoform X3 [Monodelphis domestica]
MAFPSAADLDSFKYCELQSLAKSFGLRANLRGDRLLKSLKEYFQDELKKENETQDHSEMIRSDHPGSNRQKKYQKENFLTVEEATEPSKDNQNKPICSEGNKMEGDTLLNISSGGKRPRIRDDSSKSKKRKMIFTTPNFKKIHEAHFKEMESIDKYIDRKKKRIEILNNSVKELKMLAKKANLTGTPNNSKQSSSNMMVLSPVPKRGRPSTFTPASPRRSLRTSLGTANRSILCQKLFKPSTLSTNKMNVRFTEATKDNEHKRSLTKTPARKSPYMGLVDTQPKCQTVLGKNNEKEASQVKAEHTLAVTPFKFTAEATQTPVSNKKPVFDLKASLSRPLSYEPHKGRLKPWGEAKENISLKETAKRIDFHKKTYKQPHLQTREDQRRKHEQKRKVKKDCILGSRRGLVMLQD